MPWGIVLKNAFSKNREFQTFSGVSFFIFLGISLRKSGGINKHRRRCEFDTHRRRFLFSAQQPVNGYIQDIRQGIQLNIRYRSFLAFQ